MVSVYICVLPNINALKMKKLTFLFIALLTASVSFGQFSSTGPKAKNASIGKLRLPKISVYHDSNLVTAKGPVAKNAEIWMKEPASKLKVSFRDEIKNPQGLKAKNANPWDKPVKTVDSKAVYVEPKSMKPKRTWVH